MAEGQDFRQSCVALIFVTVFSSLLASFIGISRTDLSTVIKLVLCALILGVVVVSFLLVSACCKYGDGCYSGCQACCPVCFEKAEGEKAEDNKEPKMAKSQRNFQLGEAKPLHTGFQTQNIW